VVSSKRFLREEKGDFSLDAKRGYVGILTKTFTIPCRRANPRTVRNIGKYSEARIAIVVTARNSLIAISPGGA
jgi:hypothetical protein